MLYLLNTFSGVNTCIMHLLNSLVGVSILTGVGRRTRWRRFCCCWLLETGLCPLFGLALVLLTVREGNNKSVTITVTFTLNHKYR